MTWCKSSAQVSYDPYRPGLRKHRPGSLVVANVDLGIPEYYRWWVRKRFGLQLHPPAFFPHITIVDGKRHHDKNSFWKKYQNRTIEFEYNVEFEQHWKFWTLPVRSTQLEQIRTELDLNPNYNFHITFGRME
jgi:hypothetical protein